MDPHFLNLLVLKNEISNSVMFTVESDSDSTNCCLLKIFKKDNPSDCYLYKLEFLEYQTIKTSEFLSEQQLYKLKSYLPYSYRVFTNILNEGSIITSVPPVVATTSLPLDSPPYHNAIIFYEGGIYKTNLQATKLKTTDSAKLSALNNFYSYLSEVKNLSGSRPVWINKLKEYKVSLNHPRFKEFPGIRIDIELGKFRKRTI